VYTGRIERAKEDEEGENWFFTTSKQIEMHELFALLDTI
jgi:hypothetical protein